jgi:hypothetical protein
VGVSIEEEEFVPASEIQKWKSGWKAGHQSIFLVPWWLYYEEKVAIV